MPTTTQIQQLPYPTFDQQPNVPDHIEDLARATEKKLVMRFTNASARTAVIPTPEEGMTVYLTATKEYQAFIAGAWRTMYSGDNSSTATRWIPAISYTAANRPNGSQWVGTIGWNRDSGAIEVCHGDGNFYIPPTRTIAIMGGYDYSGAPYRMIHDPGGVTFEPSPAIGWYQQTGCYSIHRITVTGYFDAGSGTPWGCEVYVTMKINGPGLSAYSLGWDSRQGGQTCYTLLQHTIRHTISYEALFLGTAVGSYNCYPSIHNAGGGTTADFVVEHVQTSVTPISFNGGVFV